MSLSNGSDEVLAELNVAIFSPQLGKVGTAPVLAGIASGLAQQRVSVDLVVAGIEWIGDGPTGTGVRSKRLLASYVAAWIPKTGCIYKISMLIVALLALPGFVFFLLRSKPDAVIASLMPWVAALGIALARSDAKLLVTVQGLPRPGRIRRIFWRLVQKRAGAFVAASTAERDALRELCGSEVECEVISNPVIPDGSVESDYSAPDHSFFENDADVPVFLGVGRLTYQKNFDLLIQAFALASASMPAQLVILGEGEDRQQLEALVESLNISDAVSMPGFVDDPFPYMGNCSAYVLSSRWEGQVTALVEALAAKAACIVVEHPGGSLETIGNGRYGKVVSANDPQQLAGALLEAIRSPDIGNSRTKLAHDEVIRNYTPAVGGKKYADIIRGMLQGTA